MPNFQQRTVRQCALSTYNIFHDDDGKMLPVNRIEPYTNQDQQVFRVGVHGLGDIFLDGDKDHLYEEIPGDDIL